MSNMFINSNRYGQAVAAARAAAGLSVVEFSKVLGVTHPVISRIENGLKPSEMMDQKIRDYFGFDPASDEVQELVATLAGER